MTMRKPSMPRAHKGVALVVVLLVVALVSIIAMTLTEQAQREIRRSANMFDYQQARSYVLGAEHFATAVLQESIKDDPDRDDLTQTWATKGLYFPIEGGSLVGEIKDLNSCFNLNSLVALKEGAGYVVESESMAYQSYQRLLVLLGLKSELIVPLGDWLDSDESVSSMDGAEDLEYELLEQPYRAANNLITDVSELRLIQGYSAEVVNRLLPYVCALPKENYFKLNINTLNANKPELLSMVIKDLSIDAAASILAERGESGYDELQDFWQLDALAGLEIDAKSKSVFTLDSDFYEFNTKARVGRGHASLTAQFKQIDKDTVLITQRRFETQK